MAKEKIPVYDICSLGDDHAGNNELLVDRFADYLRKYYAHLYFPHKHAFYHMVLFTEGAGSHMIDFSRFDVQAGQVYFMIPGQVHSWNFDGKTDGYILNFSEAFFRPFLQNQQYLERFPFFSGISGEGVCQLPEEVLNEVTGLMEAALKYVNNTDMVRLLLLQMFIRIEESQVKKGILSAPAQKQVLLKGLRKLIDANYRKLRLPKEYADQLYVTPNHLNALCQDLLGKTAGELIRDRVLLEAKRLLANAKMTVTEVAYDLNFQDNSYFNRFFKKYTGQTPDEFRKSIYGQ